MSRPLSLRKVEATGHSFSDHEALEVDLELSNNINANANNQMISKTTLGHVAHVHLTRVNPRWFMRNFKLLRLFRRAIFNLRDFQGVPF